MDFEPLEHQIPLIDYLLSNKKALIVARMGAGKTYSTLSALETLIETGSVRRCLIIGPKTVIENTWPDEMFKFGFKFVYQHWRPGVTIDAPVILVSRDMVQKMILVLASKWPFDAIAIDESTSFKNPESKRWKALSKLTKTLDVRTILLTGTPAPNGIHEIWGQIFLLDSGARLGKSYRNFLAIYFHKDLYNYRIEPKEKTKEKITALIKDLCFVVPSYSGLVERQTLEHYCTLSDSILKKYQEFKADCVASIDELEITALNAATLTNKLQQFANGWIYTDTKEPKAIHREKLDLIETLMEGIRDQGEGAIVVYKYIQDLTALKSLFPGSRVVTEPGAIQWWNVTPGHKVLLLNAMSAGHGLNLQKGGNHIIWFGPNYSNEQTEQAIARIWRPGQDKTVLVHYLLTRNTIDERILEVVQGRKTLQDAIIEDIKNENT